MTPPTPETPTGLRRWADIVEKNLDRPELASHMRAAADAWQLLIDAVNDDAGECLPECNSFGHAEGCQYVDMAGTLVRLQKRLAEAEKKAHDWEEICRHLKAEKPHQQRFALAHDEEAT